MQNAALEALRMAIPAARALPLLACLAIGEERRVVVQYLTSVSVAVQVMPCN